MRLSTANLTLAPDDALDFQLHTVYSDGKWTPADLIDHLVSENFALAAITDHDRVDTAAELQTLALEKGLPLLVAAEFTTHWRGDVTDMLIFGFDPSAPALQAIASDVLRRQQDNTREVFANLHQKGIRFDQPHALDSILALPSAAQPPALDALVQSTGVEHAINLVIESGSVFATTEIALVVDAAHRSGALALIAHPGRGGGYVPFTVERLDQLCSDVPIDGFEAYYPLHSDEQTAMFLAYAQKHGLLVSSGSDSHTPNRLPIKYPASNVRALLERLGVTIS